MFGPTCTLIYQNTFIPIIWFQFQRDRFRVFINFSLLKILDMITLDEFLEQQTKEK